MMGHLQVTCCSVVAHLRVTCCSAGAEVRFCYVFYSCQRLLDKRRPSFRGENQTLPTGPCGCYMFDSSPRLLDKR